MSSLAPSSRSSRRRRSSSRSEHARTPALCEPQIQPSVSHRSYSVAPLAHTRLGGRLGGTQPRGRVIVLATSWPRDRPCAAVPLPSAHERVLSASLAPASLRLARERALEWEGGGAAGGPISHSARSLRAQRHGLPARTSGSGQPGCSGAGSAACVPALRPHNRPRAELEADPWPVKRARSRRKLKRAAVSARLTVSARTGRRLTW